MMKIGYNCDPTTDLYETAARAGYDYVEAIFCFLAENTAEEIDCIKKKIERYGLPVLSANCLFPGNFKLLGEDATEKDVLLEYLERGFSNAESIGIKKVVCGSGKGRSLPEGYDVEAGTRELAEIFRMIADVAVKHGCMIVIEPLNANETNVCKTVKEGMEFVTLTNHPAVKLLADSYHMRAERESFDTLKNYKDVLAHTHIAEAIEGSAALRACPSRRDENNIKSFVYALKAMGYDDTLTVEANRPETDVEAIIAESAEVLREWAK